MSEPSASGYGIRQRLTLAVVVGMLTFLLISIRTQSDQGIGAGIVVTIIVWLLAAPREQKSEQKK